MRFRFPALGVLLAALVCFSGGNSTAFTQSQSTAAPSSYLLKPNRIFDGVELREGWAVMVRGEKIEAAGPLNELKAPAETKVLDLPGATLLLKGARSLVGRQGEALSFNGTGSPGMATGGMGDVLTGVIAALMGQGLRGYDAARLGAWWCGRAAEIAVEQGNEVEETLTPTRLQDYLGSALRELRG